MSEPPSVAVAAWRRSARCVSDHHCVEIVELDHGVGMRNSIRPDVSLVFSTPVWRDLIDCIKAGKLDGPHT